MARSKGPSTANAIHTDQSYNGARARIHNLDPDFDLDGCRWAIINVWRPIGRPVTRNALAICDARSIQEDDLVEGMVQFPNDPIADEDRDEHVPKGGQDPFRQYRGSTGQWQVRAPKTPGEHKWYYASDMKPEEALLLKNFDSKTKGVARRSAHTALESKEDHGPERQSLEVRCFVVWEDQESD